MSTITLLGAGAPTSPRLKIKVLMHLVIACALAHRIHQQSTAEQTNTGKISDKSDGNFGISACQAGRGRGCAQGPLEFPSIQLKIAAAKNGKVDTLRLPSAKLPYICPICSLGPHLYGPSKNGGKQKRPPQSPSPLKFRPRTTNASFNTSSSDITTAVCTLTPALLRIPRHIRVTADDQSTCTSCVFLLTVIHRQSTPEQKRTAKKKAIDQWQNASRSNPEFEVAAVVSVGKRSVEAGVLAPGAVLAKRF
ncbi:hypothetical protein BDK51DRAFT_53228 [Blyttiomyces helicus]|uniref:Uncharacterized protein n=1 Tax=Blyttiomyces helicus TaxID=388810 RepID=A0A4P9WH68_9FUNG|nr:hypothetical protein BDK51DRAFT_53228 [Blyttiomyces helicus]|eukprot:RKO91712.1 hypothetical protein BDK51DRAFT_53228 [Blyttiomyces helicus]